MSCRTSTFRLSRIVWAVLFITALLAVPVRAQDAITVVESKQQHTFKGPMTFSLAVKGQHKITAIRLFYRTSGQTAAHKVELEFEPGLDVQVEHTEDMGEEENYQPPMITFTYWWIIEDEAGNRLKTDPVSFVYEDTRYDWQVLEGDLVRLYWHDQDQSFGQGFFDIASQAATALSSEYQVTPDDPVSIVIYNSHDELMSVLQEASSEWTGAVNFGRSGCIAIGLGPLSWMDKAIPHELAHAMLDQVTKPPFGAIPRWLHEGLAVRSEGGMSGEEEAELAKAIRNDTLISLRVLNSPFADDRDRAILSYAESTSLVGFIVDEHGTEKLGELIEVFANGAHYDDAMTQVFGVDMDGMEDLWRAHIGAPSRAGVTRATPVLAATVTVLSTLAPSNTPVPSSTPRQVAEVTSTPIPTATSTSEQPVQETPVATPVPANRWPCTGAAPVLGMLALLVVFRSRAPSA